MSLYLVVGYGPRKTNPKIVHVGTDGSKARVALDTAGDKDKKITEAHLFVNPERSKHKIFEKNLPESALTPEEK